MAKKNYQLNFASIEAARKVWSDILSGSGDGVALIKEFVFGVAGLHLDTDDPLTSAIKMGLVSRRERGEKERFSEYVLIAEVETLILVLETSRDMLTSTVEAIDDVLGDIEKAGNS